MNKQIDIQVRFFDIDTNNHVNNAVYLTYMENARTELLMDDFLDYQSNGILFVVAEVNCKYKKPIRLNDKVTCHLAFELTGALHFTITYLFKNPEGMLYAEGKTKMAMINEQTNRPIRIPEALIEKHIDRLT